MAELLINSHAVDLAKILVVGFTTLPARIHKHNGFANLLTNRVISDLRKELGDYDARVIDSCFHVENLCPLVFPESQPNQIRKLSTLAESGPIQRDDYRRDRIHATTWENESRQFVNLAKLLIRSQDLTAKNARLAIKQRNLKCKYEFVSRKDIFYKSRPGMSSALTHRIEVIGTANGVSHNWRTQHRRYHSHILAVNHTGKGETNTPTVASTTSDSELSARTAKTFSFSDSDYTKEYPSTDKIHAHNELSTEKQISSHTPKWCKPDFTALLAPCEYIRSMPSKGVRSALIDALDDWINIPKESRQTIQEIVQMLHDASLILDDIEDNSPLRRGKPAVHAIFGPSQAINSANFMFVRAVQRAQKLQSPEATGVLLEELENLYLGQSLDLYWKFQLQCPTKDEYLNMVDNKTGGMFRMLIRLMLGESQYCSGVSFDRLSLLFGRFFQIRDDYMNLKSRLYSDQKGSCEDLDEGKFSFPIVCCLQNEPKYRSHILGIFRQRPVILGGGSQVLPAESKQHILKCLHEAGAMKMTLEYVKNLEVQLKAEIQRLGMIIGGKNPELGLLLKSLSLEPSAHK